MAGFGLQNYSVAEDGIVEAARQASTHWYIDGLIPENFPRQWDDRRIEGLLQLVHDHGPRPIFHGNFKIPLAHEVEELRHAGIRYTMSEIDIAHRLGTPIIIHGSVLVENKDPKAMRDRAIHLFLDSVRRIAEYASDRGVPVWVENLPDYQRHHRPFQYCFSNVLEYEFILSQVSYVSFILDVGHGSIEAENPVLTFDKLHDRIVAFSFNDNDETRDLHLPLGQGAVDFPGLLAKVHETRWQGYVFFETRGNIPVVEGMEYVSGLYGKISESAKPREPLPQSC
jgi:sugar phosphate isomerase/epimerase